jgi:N-acetylmuramate 1-kinase
MPSQPLTRNEAIDYFLEVSGWGGAEHRFLAGDASFRNYQRVFEGNRTAVLMDAPPEKEPLSPFINVAEYLVERGYSAPRIYSKSIEQGFLLLEDLGDDSFTRVLKTNPERELELYKEACNLLVDLHKRGLEGATMPAYDRTKLIDEACLFVDWYLAAVLGERQAQAIRADFVTRWNELFEALPWLPDVVVLRDFHADNLMWLAERKGFARVGLLDFQDAVTGNPAYDMVSFLEDARRDVAAETQQMVLNHYLQQVGWDRDSFMAAYALLGAQRNSKIVGIFTRLAKRDGKFQYLNLIDRVWGHLHKDLQHPALKSYSQWLDGVLPKPSRMAPILEDRAVVSA